MQHLPRSRSSQHARLSPLARALTLALLASGLALPAIAQTQSQRDNDNGRVAHREKGAFPQVTLTEHGSRGQRAIDNLGSRLPEVAAWYGKSADEFRSHLLNDATWRLDKTGRVFIVEELQGPLSSTAAPASATSTQLHTRSAACTIRRTALQTRCFSLSCSKTTAKRRVRALRALPGSLVSRATRRRCAPRRLLPKSAR